MYVLVVCSNRENTFMKKRTEQKVQTMANTLALPFFSSRGKETERGRKGNTFERTLKEKGAH